MRTYIEVAMAHFIDRASDVAAFAKNAGPQALRIDYLTIDGRRAIYTPDFLARKIDGNYLLIETKGRADRDVPNRVRAAVAWCKAASTKTTPWQYVYVPQTVLERLSSDSVGELTRACAPALADMLREAHSPQLTLNFEIRDSERAAEQVREFITEENLKKLPARCQKAVEHAVALFYFHEKKESVSFGPVFQPLLGPLDQGAESILLGRLSSDVPAAETAQKDFFEPDMTAVKKKSVNFYKERVRTLKRLLVYRSPLMPIGSLIFCLDYAEKATEPLGGIFASVRHRFSALTKSELPSQLQRIYEFRNKYIAHQDVELTDVDLTKAALKTWVEALQTLYRGDVQMAPQHIDAFLSYNRTEASVAQAIEAIAFKLKELGFTPWLDRWNLTVGEPWHTAIEAALSASRTCVIFIGASGIGSWQQAEMRTAISNQISTRNDFRVIPVLLPGTAGEEQHVPPFLSATTWIRFRSLDDLAALDRLASTIRGASQVVARSAKRQSLEVVLAGDSDIDDRVVTATVERLKLISGDPSLVLKSTKRGSVALILDASPDAAELLDFLFRTGQLSKSIQS